jgi:hypothetical protein
MSDLRIPPNRVARVAPEPRPPLRLRRTETPNAIAETLTATLGESEALRIVAGKLRAARRARSRRSYEFWARVSMTLASAPAPLERPAQPPRSPR